MSNLILPPALGARVVSREPVTDVRIDTSVSGKEARSSWWTLPRTRYKVAFEVLRQDLWSRADFQQIASLFARHFGQLDSFLFADEADSSVTDHGFAVGDGTTTAFQLQRSLLGGVYDTTGGPWAASSKPRTNLCTYSQRFDLWTQAGSSVLADSATAPDGTRTGDKLVESAANVQHYAQAAGWVQLTAGVTYAYSVWARAGGRTQVVLNIFGQPQQVAFDLSSGTVVGTSGSPTGYAIVASGNGWYRCTLLYVPATTGVATPVVAPSVAGATTAAYSGDGSSGIYLWGAQVEEGSATAYVSTVASPVTVTPAYWPSYSDGFEPVFDPAPGATLYKDGDGLGRRALASWSRTNLITYSEQFDNAAWSKSNATVTANSVAAPDGTTTADTITDSAVNDYHLVYSSAYTFTSGTPYTASVYLKAGTKTTAWVGLPNGLSSSVDVDLSAGTLTRTGADLTATITALAGGWYRVTITSSVVSGSRNLWVGLGPFSSYVGTSQTIYAWGAQIEQASAAGDYIPTVAATASKTDYVQGTTGLITLPAALASGAYLSWSGSHYKRVRLDGPGLQFERLASGFYAATVDLITVKP